MMHLMFVCSKSTIRILASLFLMVNAHKVQSQYYEFPTSTETTWKHISIAFGNIKDTIDYIHSGDTLILGKVYQKLFQGSISDSTYVGGYRSLPNGKVYFRTDSISSIQGEMLLYDFSIDVGDTIKLMPFFGIDSTAMTPLSVSCVQILNPTTGEYEQRKVLYMAWLNNTGNGEWGRYAWIEGFGSRKGILWRGSPSGWDFKHHLLNIYQKGDSLLNIEHPPCSFQNVESIWNNATASISIFPNPVQNILYIENLDNQLTSISVYNVMGKIQLTDSGNPRNNDQIDVGNLDNGVYILRVRMSNGTEQNLKFIKN